MLTTTGSVLSVRHILIPNSQWQWSRCSGWNTVKITQLIHSRPENPPTSSWHYLCWFVSCSYWLASCSICVEPLPPNLGLFCCSVFLWAEIYLYKKLSKARQIQAGLGIFSHKENELLEDNAELGGLWFTIMYPVIWIFRYVIIPTALLKGETCRERGNFCGNESLHSGKNSKNNKPLKCLFTSPWDSVCDPWDTLLHDSLWCMIGKL